MKIRASFEETEDKPLYDINYSSQLHQVLEGSRVLSRIEIIYDMDNLELALGSLLRVLSYVASFPCLSILLILCAVEVDRINLEASDLVLVSKIPAPNLEQLYLDCDLWVQEDGSEIQVAFRNMLLNFSNLTHIVITGCFFVKLFNTLAQNCTKSSKVEPSPGFTSRDRIH